MPHYKTIIVTNTTQIYIWKITEPLDILLKDIQLTDSSLLRLDTMKSENHKKEFLSIRKLLQKVGYTDFDLFYSQKGKPNLKDGKNISITHSFNFSAIIISDKSVGIDIEFKREKIKRIADKFIDYEFCFLNKEEENYVQMLTVIWSIKEALYKICDRPKLSFKQNLIVAPFEMNKKKGKVRLQVEDINLMYPVYFEEIEGFILVYAIDETSSLY